MGVQQANRAAEVNEMWRVRQKELELDERQMRRLKDGDRVESDRHLVGSSEQSSRLKEVDGNAASCQPRKRGSEGFSLHEDGSLKDEEVEEFLNSRKKRGRGSVGSRMEEPGPYLIPSSSLGLSEKLNSDSRIGEEWEQRVLGPEKPSFLKSEDEKIECFLARDKRKERDSVERSKDRHRSKKEKTHHKKKKDKKSKKKDKKSKKRHVIRLVDRHNQPIKVGSYTDCFPLWNNLIFPERF
ncbi:hypothetical protein H6P81_000052 [Aristolochia fimbriata]|uniref:Uncharacterized protein n=1 Tax=Aristolochia fimbriata TaxID=158543 RepID=A0AAV7F4F5_ARIFI|nr:hypothetical protein H6P81_000052 [Aristolochia fimbriata]